MTISTECPWNGTSEWLRRAERNEASEATCMRSLELQRKPLIYDRLHPFFPCPGLRHNYS